MKPIITIAGIIALLTGLALAQSKGRANPEQLPANVRMAPAANAQVAAKNANEVLELSVTYHLGVIDGRSFATTLTDLFSAKGIHITTQSTEETTTVIASPQYQKMVIDILSEIEPGKMKLDMFR